MSRSIIKHDVVEAEARRIEALPADQRVAAIVRLVDEATLEAAQQGVIALLPTALALHSVLPGSEHRTPRTLN